MKKFTVFIISFLFVIACTFSGCAGFSINKAKYYNEVLATVGERKITRFDLLNSYNSYGKNYFQTQQGKSEQEALNETLNLLIDREALYLYALKDSQNRFTPNEYQVNNVIEEMFKSLDESMKNYLNNAEIILNVKPISTTEEDSTKDEETAYIYSKYKKRAELVRVEENNTETYKINYLDDSINQPTTVENSVISKELLTTYADSTQNLNKAVEEMRIEYLKRFYNNVKNNYGSNANQVYNKALALRVDDLIEYEYYLRDEKNKPYNTVTNDVLDRFFKRTFENSIQGQYLTNLQTEFLKTETLSTENLLNSYKTQVLKDQIIYGNNLESYKNKLKEIGTNGDSILYHPTITDDNTQFGYFMHMLISFTEEDKTYLNSIKEMSTDDERYEQKDELYENYLANMLLKPRDASTGLTGEEVVNINNVMQEYQTILGYDNYNTRLNEFIKFMYKYTGDPGLLSGGMAYVVGTNGYSQMVDEFNKEAIALMQGSDGNKVSGTNLDGNMTSWGNGKKYSELCISTHGIHLLFYVGDVKKFDNNNLPVTIGLEDKTNEFNLYYRIANPITGKTYFDLMFDTVYPAESGSAFTSNNGYSSYETAKANESKNKYGVVKYNDKIKNTKTSI